MPSTLLLRRALLQSGHGLACKPAQSRSDSTVLTCCCRYARAGARVAAVLLSMEHMAEALAQILDALPPPEASSAVQDPLAAARYASRPLALQVVRLACQASAGVAAAAHALGASFLFTRGVAQRSVLCPCTAMSGQRKAHTSVKGLG